MPHYCHENKFDTFRCASCPHPDFELSHSGVDDYADIDYCPTYADCEACGEYVFPEAVSAHEAEAAYFGAMYKRAQREHDPKQWFMKNA